VTMKFMKDAKTDGKAKAMAEVTITYGDVQYFGSTPDRVDLKVIPKGVGGETE